MTQRLIVTLLALTTLGVTTAATQHNNRPPAAPVTYTAFAVSPGGVLTPSVATQVEITINRWSTGAESQRLMTVLKERGADKLLDALQDVKSVGTIRTPGDLAYDLRFAHAEP